MRKKELACGLSALLGLATVFGAETLNETYEGGFAYGQNAKHFAAQKLVGANAGTVLFDIALGKPAKPFGLCRSIASLRTASRLRFSFYSCSENKTLLCSFSDNDGEHTWRVETPEITAGERMKLGFSWDGTVVRCLINGRVFASGVQPLPLEKVTELHFGPYRDGWMAPSPWADDVTLYGVKVYDEALSPAAIAADAGVTLKPLAETNPMFLTVTPRAEGAESMPQLITGNHPEKSGTMPEHGFDLSYDAKNFYLRFKSRFPGNVPIVTGEERTATREPPLWGTESFEFRFKIGETAYCFGGNVAGGYSEGRNEDYTWNAPWSYTPSKSMNIDDSILWRGEVAIPWSSLGLAEPPQDLMFNFCRSWKLPAIGCHTSLHLKGGSYTDLSGFVAARLGSAPIYELKERSNPSEGTYREKFTLTAAKATKAVYAIELAALDGSLSPMPGVRRAYSLAAGEKIEDTFDFPTGVPGYDALLHTLTADGRVVMREIVPYKLDDKFFFATPLLLHEKIRLTVKNVMLKLKYGGAFSGKVILTGPDRRVVGEWPVTRDVFEIPFSVKGPTGDYLLRLVDAATGREIDTRTVKFPGLGDWAKQDFHPERIIKPFKPLTTTVTPGACDALASSFSERSYGWKNSLLLSSVVSKEVELLPKGAEILVGGEPLAATSFKVGLNKPHRVEFTGAAKEATLSGWLEYDGVTFNTLKVNAPGKSLAIRYTMPSENVKFLHGARGGAWGMKITECVKDGRSVYRYYPVLWLCDQERGLAFFTETRAGWTADERTCYTIEKGPTECVITVAMMDKLPETTFEVQFGFQATPMRPLAAEHPYEVYGQTHGRWLNRPGRIPTTRYAAIASDNYNKLAYDTASFFGDLDIQTGRNKDFICRKLYEECHDHPLIRPTPYTCARWLSTLYPEVAAYVEEWKLVPELALDNEGTGHFMVDMCPTTLANDYFMWCFRKMLERYPEQRGIYCDFGTVKECSNENHGCHGEIPLLAFREFVRRLAVVQTDFYDDMPFVVLHNTDCNQIPCLSFATHLFNGEQVRQASTAMLHNKRDILDNYGLEMFACELSTLPMGVCNGPYFPFDRLSEKNGGDEGQAAYAFRMDKAAFAGTLVHDHFPSQARNHYGIFDKVYRVYEDFGVGSTARFVGYWKNPAVVTGATNVYVSCYTDGKKVLAVIGHIGKEHEDKDVAITFDPKVLGLTGSLASAVDTMTRPDPDYGWLFEQSKKYNVPPWRCPIEIGEFGTRVDGFDGRTLKYHLPFHTYGIVELK